MDFTIGGNFNGCMQSLYQQLGIEWLRQEGKCPGRKRSFANIHFIVRGDKDDGEAVAESFEPFLHIKSVEARHLHVEDDAFEPFRRHGFDMVNELLARSESGRLYSQCAHEGFYRMTNGLIVVHNRNKWFALAGHQGMVTKLHRATAKTS